MFTCLNTRIMNKGRKRQEERNIVIGRSRIENKATEMWEKKTNHISRQCNCYIKQLKLADIWCWKV